MVTNIAYSAGSEYEAPIGYVQVTQPITLNILSMFIGVESTAGLIFESNQSPQYEVCSVNLLQKRPSRSALSYQLASLHQHDLIHFQWRCRKWERHIR